VALKVFVSSAMREFKTERKAIHERLRQAAIALPGLLEGWVFEFTPPAGVPADESYLANVRNCDIFVLMFGAEGPRPAVLRECREALSCKKPILALAQRQAGTDEAPPDVQRILRELNRKYRLFDDPAEIVELVSEALGHHIADRVQATEAASRALSQVAAPSASLRILCVVPSALRDPNGYDTPELDFMREWDNLCRSTRGLSVRMELLWPATLARLDNALAMAKQARAPYAVVHISCHGSPGALLFDDGDGEGVMVPAADLAAILQAAPPELLVVSACSLAAAAGTASSIAAAARGAGVKATVAMAGAVLDELATRFATQLYGQLALGVPVAQAYQAGLLALPREARTDVLLEGDGEVRLTAVPFAADETWLPDRSMLPERRRFLDRVDKMILISRRLDVGNEGVVWLWGEGGLGKTALALELAWRNAWRFRGVLWVPFDRMPPTLASILAVAKRDFSFEGAGDPRQGCDFLARLGYMFVLDDLDEVLAGARHGRPEQTQVIDWLRTLPRSARALTTSRLAPPPQLGVGHAVELLDPLPEGAAVELFFAAAGGPRTLDYDSVKEVCQRLGNLPLEVELAGARARGATDLTSLLGYLPAAPGLVGLRGGIAADEVSLTGSLGFSFKRLADASTRDALAFLAAFPVIDTRMAMKVLNGGRGLAQLTELHIARRVEPAGSPAAWSALPPVRQAAQQWLGKDNVDRALRRGAEYIESLTDPAQIDADNAVEAMHKLGLLDGQRALVFAKVNDTLHDRSFWAQARALRQAGVELATDQKDELAAARWSRQYAVSLQEQGDTDEAQGVFEQALETFRRLGDKAGEALTIRNLGRNRYRQGRYDEAEGLLNDALQRFECLGDKLRMGKSYRNLGLIAQARHKYDEAAECYEKAHTLFAQVGQHVEAARSRQSSAIAAQERGRWDEAEELYKQTLRVFQNHNNWFEVANNCRQLGTVARHRGQYAEAERLYRRALELCEVLGDQPGVARSYRWLGVLAGDRGKYDEAQDWFNRALPVFERIGYQPSIAQTLRNLGLVARASGRLDEASSLCERACGVFERLRDEVESAKTRLCLGSLALERGRHDEAEQLCRQALRAFERLGDQAGVLRTYDQLASIARARGNGADADALSNRTWGLFWGDG